MKASVILLTLTALLLSGCTSGYDGKPYNGSTGVQFYSDYDGTNWSDEDDDLHMRVWLPDGEYMTGIRIANNEQRDLPGGGGAFSCVKYDSEWRDKPWWMEVAIYTEADFNVEVDRVRVNDTDCLLYSIEIASDGSMTVHEGYPPWHPDAKPKLEDWAKNTLLILGLVAVIAALVFISRPRRGSK